MDFHLARFSFDEQVPSINLWIEWKHTHGKHSAITNKINLGHLP